MGINHRTLETSEKILILVFEIKDISMRYIHMKQKRTLKLKQLLSGILDKRSRCLDTGIFLLRT